MARLPKGMKSSRGRSKIWLPSTPYWLRHPKDAAEMMERNAAYFERKAKALRTAAEAFRSMAKANGKER